MTDLKARLGLNSGDKLLGLVFIFLVSVIWVVASFLVQDIEATGVHPVVITYISNSLFALYFPVYWVGKVYGSQKQETINEQFLKAYRNLCSDCFGTLRQLAANELCRAAALVRVTYSRLTCTMWSRLWNVRGFIFCDRENRRIFLG